NDFFPADVWIQLDNNSQDTVYFFTDDNLSLSMVRPNSQLARMDYSGTFEDGEKKDNCAFYLKKKGSALEVDAQYFYSFETGKTSTFSFGFSWNGSTLTRNW
ncbi:MAG: hypothetical protein WAT91_15870, partial [Saprospiraceae bacterium]